ncbi:unnamed protein product [Adineta steineri]|uniref:Uncharacterized protein n=1 Tax=Adineta steineri TaxID=433720 RepID=A0A819ILF9_9BILA|nr:unnamed protein product [Adineta steineri]CAF3913818.1 unnamed protein product [Adineta steineri]
MSLLTNEKVLVVGGYNGDRMNSSELYNTSTDTWTIDSSMNDARDVHQTSILTDGKVLATGGFANVDTNIGLKRVHSQKRYNFCYIDYL